MVQARRPKWINPRNCETGKPASSELVGKPLQQAVSHLINWAFNGCLFVYSGPPDDASPSANPDTGVYYIILSSPEKRDTSNPERNVCVAWLGWPTAAAAGGVDPQVDWIDPDSNTQTLYSLDLGAGAQFTPSIAYGDSIPLVNAVCHYHDEDAAPIEWTPDGTNEFRVAQIDYQAFRFAALTVFEAPMKKLPPTQSIDADEVAEGKTIRGFDGTNVESLGGIMHLVGGEDGGGSVHVETAERIGRRCWQWGHGKGIHIDDTSYVNIFGDLEGMFKTRQLTEVAQDVKLKPAFYVACTNNGGSSYIKVTNTVDASTWVWSGTGTDLATPFLIDYTDGTPATGIAWANNARETWKIEAKVDSGEELLIHTCALWEGSHF